MTTRNILKIVTIIVLGLFTLFSQKEDAGKRIPAITQVATSSGGLASAPEDVRVTRVIDGDTIELENGQKVRYIGIDTPETVDRRQAVMCFGREASQENKRLVEGKLIRLEKDVSEVDRYGRLLRYVYTGGVFVNDRLVRQGYAHSSTFPPDVKYQKQFVEAQNEAREGSRGLWSACK